MPLAVAAPDALSRHAPALLLGGCVALYACSRLLVTLLPRAHRAAADDGTRTGARAVAYFVPIAVASVVAMFLGRPEVAVAIVFGTSVGAITTVVGFVALAGPVGVPPPGVRRVWPFLLAATLLVFVAGFGGIFKWRDALALLTEGLLLFTLWNDRGGPPDAEVTTTTHDVLQQAATGAVVLNYATPRDDPRRPVDWVILIVELALIATLLWFGAWMATQGAVRGGPAFRGLSTSAIAGSIVSLALVMPMTHGTWRRSAPGGGWAPVTTQIGVVLLNLCLLLPILILIPYAAARVDALARWTAGAYVEGEGVARLLLFPVPMWRIDNVILIIAGVLLLPVGLGKWTLGREEGMVLIAAYFVYLMATVAGGMGG